MVPDLEPKERIQTKFAVVKYVWRRATPIKVKKARLRWSMSQYVGPESFESSSYCLRTPEIPVVDISNVSERTYIVTCLISSCDLTQLEWG